MAKKDVSKRIGDLLLQRWTMLGEVCPNTACTGVPLMRDADKRMLCVSCDTFYVHERDFDPAKHKLTKRIEDEQQRFSQQQQQQPQSQQQPQVAAQYDDGEAEPVQDNKPTAQPTPASNAPQQQPPLQNVARSANLSQAVPQPVRAFAYSGRHPKLLEGQAGCVQGAHDSLGCARTGSDFA